MGAVKRQVKLQGLFLYHKKAFIEFMAYWRIVRRVAGRPLRHAFCDANSLLVAGMVGVAMWVSFPTIYF